MHPQTGHMEVLTSLGLGPEAPGRTYSHPHNPHMPQPHPDLQRASDQGNPSSPGHHLPTHPQPPPAAPSSLPAGAAGGVGGMSNINNNSTINPPGGVVCAGHNTTLMQGGGDNTTLNESGTTNGMPIINPTELSSVVHALLRTMHSQSQCIETLERELRMHRQGSEDAVAELKLQLQRMYNELSHKCNCCHTGWKETNLMLESIQTQADSNTKIQDLQVHKLTELSERHQALEGQTARLEQQQSETATQMEEKAEEFQRHLQGQFQQVAQGLQQDAAGARESMQQQMTIALNEVRTDINVLTSGAHNADQMLERNRESLDELRSNLGEVQRDLAEFTTKSGREQQTMQNQLRGQIEGVAELVDSNRQEISNTQESLLTGLTQAGHSTKVLVGELKDKVSKELQGLRADAVRDFMSVQNSLEASTSKFDESLRGVQDECRRQKGEAAEALEGQTRHMKDTILQHIARELEAHIGSLASEIEVKLEEMKATVVTQGEFDPLVLDVRQLNGELEGCVRKGDLAGSFHRIEDVIGSLPQPARPSLSLASTTGGGRFRGYPKAPVSSGLPIHNMPGGRARRNSTPGSVYSPSSSTSLGRSPAAAWETSLPLMSHPGGDKLGGGGDLPPPHPLSPQPLHPEHAHSPTPIAPPFYGLGPHTSSGWHSPSVGGSGPVHNSHAHNSSFPAAPNPCDTTPGSPDAAAAPRAAPSPTSKHRPATPHSTPGHTSQGGSPSPHSSHSPAAATADSPASTSHNPHSIAGSPAAPAEEA